MTGEGHQRVRTETLPVSPFESPAEKAEPLVEEPLVELRDVSCGTADGEPVLEGIDLTVARGECVLLCGRSGMGKTLITKCINGLIPQFEPGMERTGDVRVCGLEPALCEMYDLASHVGSVFQNPKSQFFNTTSNDELAFGLETAGVDVDVIESRIRETITRLHAERLLGRDVTKMSGGEKQSLVFASVHVMDPDVYVLDEPSANLDLDAIGLLHDQIAAVIAQGKTVIIAEHRLSFLSDLIDRAVLVEDGRIVRQFLPEELRSLSGDDRERLGLRSTDPAGSEEVNGRRPLAAAHDAKPVERGLSLRGFSCGRKKEGRVFSPVDLDVPRGEVVGVVAGNGTGKTTFLRAIAGLERMTEGKVWYDGDELGVKARRRFCSLVMQDVNHQLFGDSVRNECELSGHVGDDRVDELLTALDLIEVKERHPMALSGGQKQRLAIACALLSECGILLLDEPTSGLDLHHMIEVSTLVRTMAARGICVLVATHDREFLSRGCDRIYELKGR